MTAASRRSSTTLALFLVANVALALTLHAASMGRSLAVGPSPPQRLDAALFLLWCTALVGTSALGAFAAARLVERVLPAIAWRLPAVLASAGLAIAAGLDLRAYAVVGVHLYSPTVNQALRNAEINRELHLSLELGYQILVLYACLCLAEWLLLRACDRLSTRTRLGSPSLVHVRAFCATTIAIPLLSAGAVAAFHHRLASPTSPAAKALPLYELAFAGHRKPPEFRITYPGTTAASAAAPPASPVAARAADLLLIAVESLRADAFTASRMPRLTEFARAHGCLTPRRHFSSSHRTEFAIFSLLYALDAYHYEPFSKHPVPSLPLASLGSRGYRLGGASASALSRYNGAGFVVDQLGDYREFLSTAAWQDDARVAAWARAFAAGDRGRPFFAFLFLNSTHVSYSYPPAFDRARPTAPEDLRKLLHDGESPALRQGVRNRYDNSVAYVDSLLADLMTDLARPDLAIVITGDHGEELWEEGLFGHAAPRFDNERVQVPLIACLPGRVDPGNGGVGGGVGGAIGDGAVSGHVDILPTMLEWAGAPLPPGSAQGHSLLGGDESAADQLQVITGAAFPIDCDRLCLIAHQRKHWLVQDPEWLDRYSVVKVTDLDDRPQPLPDDGALLDLIGRFNRRFATFLSE